MKFSTSLFNIHTHQANPNKGKFIQSLHNHFEKVETHGKFSIGLHPWFIEEENWKKEMGSILECCQHKNVAAIGECGLDNLCDTDFHLQKNVFIQQVILANKIHKPLIIHCVRAWQEVLHLLHMNNDNVPVIFHGFNGKLSIVKQIVNEGYYLSFGKAILYKPFLLEVLRFLPISKLFLETDDDDISIETIYQAASNALEIDINSLSLQINKNAADVLGVHFFNNDDE